MILFLSDLHGWYGLVNEQIRHAEARFHEKIAAVIELGDFGLFGPALHEHFLMRNERFLRPFYFVEGNHEDFTHFETLTRVYHSHLTHIPRGSVQEIGGKRVLGFGGASYMDPRITPHGSVIRDEDIDRCLALPDTTVDIIVSHDCPKGLG
ncbi:MAG TPA: metallophosphoesterase, partial [Candidatus Ozemobacteraceae bacterium]|nr:metallophosphoesterase [Candidatus Ozemobacteraceae bacterium]